MFAPSLRRNGHCTLAVFLGAVFDANLEAKLISTRNAKRFIEAVAPHNVIVAVGGAALLFLEWFERCRLFALDLKCL